MQIGPLLRISVLLISVPLCQYWSVIKRQRFLFITKRSSKKFYHYLSKNIKSGSFWAYVDTDANLYVINGPIPVLTSCGL